MAIHILQGERLETIEVQPRRLTPAEAELHIVCTLSESRDDIKVRGRLMGPSCPYAGTIEVAYPMRVMSHDKNTVTVRVLIPEPSFWDPVSPFLYRGPLELWSESELLGKVQMTHGLRAFELTRNLLRWNGKPLPLQGVVCDDSSPEKLRQLHEAGNNLLIVSVEEADTMCELADQIGYLVVFRVNNTTQLNSARRRLGDFTCGLGACAATTATDIVEQVDMLLCAETDVATWQHLGLPKLVRRSGDLGEKNGTPTFSSDDVIGYFTDMN